jgi:acetate kinase
VLAQIRLDHDMSRLSAVGHRVVHGGSQNLCVAA